ncbi:hypothetical protein DYB32_007701 [Aphanomyces invadans]|uniref:Sel1 repeat family protein n=1 Tax=Aphanomyces invadans TaxID=157072 RepID=A0A3R6V803_9STRA|nr:hypothetical protein DYB32_007701 [Aphanomyces invadans]
MPLQLITPSHVAKLAETTPPAKLYQMGQAIFENSTGNVMQSVLLWQAAAAKGHLNAKYSYAQCLKQGKGDLKPDPVAATTHFRQKGDAHAKSILGDWYFNGVHHVAQNIPLGLSLRQEAAMAGVPNALFNMGCLYRVGDHVEKDEAVAYQLFQKAATKGHGMAMFNVALMLHDGIGVAENKDAAKKWLEALAPHDIQAKELLRTMA